AMLADLHRAFLRQQADAHARFMALLLKPTLLYRGATSSPLTSAMAIVPAAPARSKPIEPAQEPASDEKSALTPSGPLFTRADLGVLASGDISSVFGPMFKKQDRYARQVRMPEPPLLLADRVLGIAGTPGEMGRGTIWTETCVTPDAWYLHE